MPTVGFEPKISAGERQGLCAYLLEKMTTIRKTLKERGGRKKQIDSHKRFGCANNNF